MAYTLGKNHLIFVGLGVGKKKKFKRKKIEHKEAREKNINRYLKIREKSDLLRNLESFIYN